MKHPEAGATLEELKRRVKGLRSSLEELEEILYRKSLMPSRVRVAARALHVNATATLETACEYDGLTKEWT